MVLSVSHFGHLFLDCLASFGLLMTHKQLLRLILVLDLILRAIRVDEARYFDFFLKAGLLQRLCRLQ